MDISYERDIMKDIHNKPQNFGIFFDEYYPTIYRYILKCTAEPTIAQDIASETFLKAYQNVGKFKWQEVTICNWFYKIASNELRMYFRKNKYSSESLDDLYENTGFDPKGDQDLVEELIEAETIIEREKDFLKMQKILSSLSEKYQEVILLHYIEGKKIKEISFILNKSEGTIKSLLSRGIVKLHDLLKKEK